MVDLEKGHMCLYEYMRMDTHVCVPHSYCRAPCSFVSQPQINLEVLIVVAVFKKRSLLFLPFSRKKTLVDFTGKMFSKCLQGIPACCSAPVVAQFGLHGCLLYIEGRGTTFLVLGPEVLGGQ